MIYGMFWIMNVVKLDVVGNVYVCWSVYARRDNYFFL